MSVDSIGRPADPPPTTTMPTSATMAAMPRAACAIAAVRGDVTTMRAAALVQALARARRRDPIPEAWPAPAGAAAAAPAFPAHLLRAGPA